MVSQWFYQTAEGQQSGPIDSKELRRLADAGIVKGENKDRHCIGLVTLSLAKWR